MSRERGAAGLADHISLLSATNEYGGAFGFAKARISCGLSGLCYNINRVIHTLFFLNIPFSSLP